MANVSLRHISKRFGHVDAVRDLSLVVNDGEFVVLLGPSGAGKTTALRLVTGLERPDAGSVFIDGRDVTRDPPGTRDIAFVFQQYSLYPHLTVYDNLAFPLRSPARRVPEADPKARRTDRRAFAHHQQAFEPGDAAFRRRDAAGGDRARAGARPVHLFDGRAVVVARCQVARRIAARAQADPARARLDHSLCDA